jgi:hypothetical protein
MFCVSWLAWRFICRNRRGGADTGVVVVDDNGYMWLTGVDCMVGLG